MKKSNLKKIIGGVVLTLMIGVGLSINVHAKGNDVAFIDGTIGEDLFIYEEGENFGYYPYGITETGKKMYKDKAEVEEYVKEGILTEKQGELEIKFLEAKNDDEKEMIFKEIIDNSKKEYGLTDEDANVVKKGGYKNFNENLDRVFYNSLVKDGVMTNEEVDIELMYYGAKNKEERQAAYVKLVNNLVTKGKLTKEQGNKFKNDGYKKHMDNMSLVRYEQMIDDMVKDGFIDKNKADDLKKSTNEYRFDVVCDLYDLYMIELDFKEGIIKQEELDLWKKLYSSTTSEDKDKIYNEILDLQVKEGKITNEEAVMYKI